LQVRGGVLTENCGWFRSVDESSGSVLYKSPASSGIIGNPITYVHDGKQYVAVLTGVGGWAAISGWQKASPRGLRDWAQSA